MQDVCDQMLPSLPAIQQGTRTIRTLKKEKWTAEDAIRSIARISRFAHMSVDSSQQEKQKSGAEKTLLDYGKSKEGDDLSNVVTHVRELRSERDELRRKDRILRGENSHLK